MPCSATNNKLRLYSETLQELQNFVLINRQCYYLFDGDFNTDLHIEDNISAVVNALGRCTREHSECWSGRAI
jgi:hypothetical protein